jgi:hypothetical protein
MAGLSTPRLRVGFGLVALDAALDTELDEVAVRHADLGEERVDHGVLVVPRKVAEGEARQIDNRSTRRPLASQPSRSPLPLAPAPGRVSGEPECAA